MELGIIIHLDHSSLLLSTFQRQSIDNLQPPPGPLPTRPTAAPVPAACLGMGPPGSEERLLLGMLSFRGSPGVL